MMQLEYQTANHLELPPQPTQRTNSGQPNKILPLAQSRAHMHRQEDNSHPASQRMLTHKSQQKEKKRKENLNKPVCISIWTRRIPHARASTKHGRVCSFHYSPRFKFSSVKPYPPESPPGRSSQLAGGIRRNIASSGGERSWRRRRRREG